MPLPFNKRSAKKMKINQINETRGLRYWQSAAIGAAIGTAQSAMENQMNYTSARSMAGVNFNYNEKAADNAMKRGLALWEYTQSPEAMVKHLKAAGLSPGLMLGGVSAGGAASGGPQGEGDSGMAAPEMKMRILEGAAIASQIEKTNAETNNIKADTEKKHEETELTKLNQALADKNIQQAQQILRKLTVEGDLAEGEKEAKLKALVAAAERDEAKANADKEMISDYIKKTKAETGEAQARERIANYQAEVFKNENWIYTDDKDDSQGEQTYKRIMRRCKEIGLDVKTIAEIIGDITKISMIGKMTPRK